MRVKKGRKENPAKKRAVWYTANKAAAKIELWRRERPNETASSVSPVCLSSSPLAGIKLREPPSGTSWERAGKRTGLIAKEEWLKLLGEIEAAIDECWAEPPPLPGHNCSSGRPRAFISRGDL
ncbi:hypothetical protein HPB48_025500 [Haemaphysalis longicornis]|uniref:Uncharacterized protein n=1 Tax=Haemaphysalis longicornis TaxID=44386 RepID=A0A9J6H7Q4_HAELO|nr:hypothetical protein HPB48_025500 [Haemaphysalis longicornis]